MSEPWLREKDGTWVQSPQNQGVYNITVNQLMLPNIKCWDKEKIESLFPEGVARYILNTPLFDVIEEDKLVWHDDIHGQYNVKSGYKLLVNSTGLGGIEVAHENMNCIWNIQAPPKTKHLLWRICKGCLPTRMRLKERCVTCPLVCSLYDSLNEDEMHIFFQCHDSIRAMETAGLKHVIESRLMRYNTAKELILHICQFESKDVAGKFAMLLWILWNNRNNSVWNNIREPSQNLGAKSVFLWQEWHAAQLIITRPVQTENNQQQTQWQQPPFGWVKCNVDAGFHNEISLTSRGWCIRDNTGQYVMAGSAWSQGK
jgi:hypothetical protein